MPSTDTGSHCSNHIRRGNDVQIAGENISSNAADVLNKHHSKSVTPSVNRLPDPRTIAGIRNTLELEDSEVRN